MSVKSVKQGKVIIFSAPSGSGKSTVVNHLLEVYDCFAFSISATSRAPRGAERDGVEYYFISDEEFSRRVAAGEFVEHEEVYAGTQYGTLKSEVSRLWNDGKVILFDVDVKGGVNLKRYFGDAALSVFVKAPSIDELRRRLELRGTDDPQSIEKRVRKASEELEFAPQFDVVLVNDNLERCLSDAESTVSRFLKK